jgi:hypothetical protein
VVVQLNKAGTLAAAHEKHPEHEYGNQALEEYRGLTDVLLSRPSQRIGALEGAANLEMRLHNNAKAACAYLCIAIKKHTTGGYHASFEPP